MHAYSADSLNKAGKTLLLHLATQLTPQDYEPALRFVRVGALGSRNVNEPEN
jgi:hypothetical protein